MAPVESVADTIEKIIAGPRRRPSPNAARRVLDDQTSKPPWNNARRKGISGMSAPEQLPEIDKWPVALPDLRQRR